MARSLQDGNGKGVTVLQPVSGACSPAPAPCFAPIYGSSAISGSVNLNEGLSYSGSNGGLNNGNPGPVEFTISAAGIGAISNGMFSSFVAGGRRRAPCVGHVRQRDRENRRRICHRRDLHGHRRQRQHMRRYPA